MTIEKFGTMAKRTLIRSALVAAMIAPSLSSAHAVSPYLPNSGELELTVGTKYEDYDRAWQGKNFSRYNRVTTIQEYRAAISYGITDRLAIDINGGYGTLTGGLGGGAGNCAHLSQDTFAGRDCQNPIPQGSRDGILDTRIGLRYAVFKENPDLWDSLPTVAIYGGALIEGDYYPRPQALGDGASGWEIGAAFGRYWSNLQFGVTADVTYANVSGVVPDYLYGSFGAYKVLGKFFVTGAYRYQHSFSGWDSGYTAYAIPPGTGANDPIRDSFRILNALGRKENFQVWEVGLGYSFDNGTSIHGTYSEVFDGRNTALRETFQAYVTVPVQIFGGN